MRKTAGAVTVSMPWSNTGQAVEAVKAEATHILIMENPKPEFPGYSKATGYVPIGLTYRPYTAEFARDESLAGGDQFSYDSPNRSYLGKTNNCANEKQLDVLLETKKALGEKPVIVALDVTGPMVISEVELYADVILMGFEDRYDGSAGICRYVR